MPNHVRPYHAGPKTLTEIIGHGIKVVSFGSTKLPIAYKLFKTEDILKLALVTLEKHFLHYGARGSQYLYNSFYCGGVIYYITKIACHGAKVITVANITLPVLFSHSFYPRLVQQSRALNNGIEQISNLYKF